MKRTNRWSDDFHRFVVKTTTSHLMAAVLRRCVQMNIFSITTIIDTKQRKSCDGVVRMFG